MINQPNGNQVRVNIIKIYYKCIVLGKVYNLVPYRFCIFSSPFLKTLLM